MDNILKTLVDTSGKNEFKHGLYDIVSKDKYLFKNLYINLYFYSDLHKYINTI